MQAQFAAAIKREAALLPYHTGDKDRVAVTGFMEWLIGIHGQEENMQTFDAQTHQVWWLAIDRAYTSYAELRQRRVIAQGWPQLGNLQALYALDADPANEALFKAEIENLSGVPGGDNAPNPLWNLSQIRAGDLIVGVEGTSVKGICQAKVDGWSSYRFDELYSYAQTVCWPVTWLMWNVGSMGQPPRVGRQGILGCMKVQNEHERVIEAWEKLIHAS